MRTIIFDMDGVIMDSEQVWKLAEKEVFTSLGVKVTDESARLTQSMTTSEATAFWYHAFPWQGKTLHEAEQMVITRVIELIETGDYRMHGVKPFIEKLKAKNYQIGLATNSPRKIIPIILEKAGVAHLFDAVSSAESEKNGKPAPDIYYTTAKKLRTDPKDCMVFEDSYYGMVAAKEAGMTVVAFTNGNTDADFEIADFHLADFRQTDAAVVKMLMDA